MLRQLDVFFASTATVGCWDCHYKKESSGKQKHYFPLMSLQSMTRLKERSSRGLQSIECPKQKRRFLAIALKIVFIA